MPKLLQSYLRFWAKIYLKRAKPKIVAITGSVGKTSTKEAIFEVLKIKFGKNLRKSEGNLNNETGVPLAILGFQESPTNFWGWLPIILSAKFRSLFGKKTKVLVLELAADKPGDIAYLTSFIKPDVACLTNIGPAHLTAFGTLEKIIEEKTALLKVLPAGGWLVLNADDENLRQFSFSGPWQTLTYAIDKPADLLAKNITTEINNFLPVTKFQVLTEKEKFRSEIHTLGRAGNIYSALAAVAVGQIFAMSTAEIIEGLKNVYPEEHRLAVLAGKNSSIIIDDSYNANPLSMRAALDILKDLPKPPAGGRKIAVLGDMREIGKITDSAHKLIGQYAHEVADVVVAVGNLAQKYQAKIYFKDSQEAIKYLLAEIKVGDIILIKASRAIGLDKIVAQLKK